MSTKLFLTFLSCTCAFLLGCAQNPSVDTRAEADKILTITAQWSAAINAGEIEKIVSLFAAEGVAIYPNTPICVGHQAIREAYKSWLADSLFSKNFSSKVDAIEVSTSGDLAYIWGTNRFSQNTLKGRVDYADKSVSIYKKINGKWKVVVDISNSNQLASGQ